MKRASPSNSARKSIIPESAEHRIASDATRKLRLDLTAVRDLAGLSSEQFGALGAQLRVCRFHRRAIVYSGKQAGDTIHIVLTGIARLTCINRKNERILFEVLSPGDVICIPTLMPDLRHSLECEAFTDCQVGVLSAQALVEIVGLEYRKFLLALRLTMGRWWASLVRQAHFVDQTLEERLAVTLLDLADKLGRPDARGIIMDVLFSHRSLAELARGSRPKVSECM